MLAERRGHRNAKRLPPLTEAQILRWADAHRRRTGAWPTADSGPVPDSGGETWYGVDAVLKHGCRGLPGGVSLARLLARRRGVPNRMDLPPVTEDQILAWAEAHRRRTGDWPDRKTHDPVPGAAGETWTALDTALKRGHRGLPGGSSLARLLAERGGARNRTALPQLTEEQILVWADAHHRRTGRWPQARSGEVVEAPGTTWKAVEESLRAGCRGLPGGSTLRRLLVQYARLP